MVFTCSYRFVKFKLSAISIATASCLFLLACDNPPRPCPKGQRYTTAQRVDESPDDDYNDGLTIHYCVDGKLGYAAGLYNCTLGSGLGRVDGHYQKSKPHGNWTFRTGNGELLRQEVWYEGKLQATTMGQLTHIAPFPDKLKRLECDGWVLRRRQASRTNRQIDK